MGENNKPFACTAHGCGMTFTNEDHLTVHKKKHDMSLNLGSGQKTNVFVADQTPTPTRFIRNCEEVGLFQDLQNVNPFEEQFRKAAEAATSGTAMAIREMDPLAGPQPDDMLHTPHVFPLIESVPCNGSSAGSGSGPTTTKAVGKEDEERLPSSSNEDKLSANKILSVDLDDADDIIVLNHLKRAPEENGKVIDNLGAQELPPGTKINASDCLKKESVVNVLLRMPDGRLVQLSGLSVDSPPPAESTVGPIPISTNWPASVSSNDVISPNIVNPLLLPAPKQPIVPQNGKPQGLSLAKLKLKEILQSSSSSKAASKKDDRSSSWSGQRSPQENVEKISSTAVTLPNSKQLKLTNDISGKSPEKSKTTKINQGKKRAKSPVPVEGAEKRLRFLERNRAAASRCRERRKNWIKSLQRKSVGLEASNVSLLAEVASLRAEVAQLRTLLLAHKDCPVTLMMQNQPLQKQVTGQIHKQSEPSVLVEAVKPVEKKTGTVICRKTPKLSIPKKASGTSLSGGSGGGQVLLLSTAQSLASQQGQIIERQHLFPSIAQTAMGTLLLPSTPESARIGSLRELQPNRVAVPEPSADKTVAVVVANPTVMHAVKISALNHVPMKLLCSPQHLTDTISVTNSKEECRTVQTALILEKDNGKFAFKIDPKTSDAV